jgi:hypothetical protein
MSSYVSQRTSYPAELSVTAAFTGVQQLLGVTSQEAILWIPDNQSDVDVAFYINGVLWKTFQAGEALVVDANSDKGKAPLLPLPKGSRLSVVGTAGTGAFRVSLIYKD